MNTALDKAVKDVRADSVHLGLGNLPEGYYGNDVIVGVTDWGFDYTSPVFYDTALQQTRIIAAWDQYKLQAHHLQIFPMELNSQVQAVYYKQEVILPIYIVILHTELMLPQSLEVAVLEQSIEVLRLELIFYLSPFWLMKALY